jgi:SAM-dependent methyltransferase
VDDPGREHLRTVFDRAAEDYQRTRPVCPPQLFDDLIDLAGLGAGDRVLEIGCGTGQATVPLAGRGLAVTAVELGAGLAAIARRRLAGFPAAEVVTSAFEDWTPPGTPFGAVVAVSSLHWIDPRLRYRKPHGLLRSGGTMAVAGCLFTEVASRRYPFQLCYSARDYLAILASQSGTHALGEARRAEFLARVGCRLESLGWPRLTATFVAYLTVGRRV